MPLMLNSPDVFSLTERGVLVFNLAACSNSKFDSFWLTSLVVFDDDFVCALGVSLCLSPEAFTTFDDVVTMVVVFVVTEFCSTADEACFTASEVLFSDEFWTFFVLVERWATTGVSFSSTIVLN